MYKKNGDSNSNNSKIQKLEDSGQEADSRQEVNSGHKKSIDNIKFNDSDDHHLKRFKDMGFELNMLNIITGMNGIGKSLMIRKIREEIMSKSVKGNNVVIEHSTNMSVPLIPLTLVFGTDFLRIDRITRSFRFFRNIYMIDTIYRILIKITLKFIIIKKCIEFTFRYQIMILQKFLNTVFTIFILRSHSPEIMNPTIP